MLGSFDPSLPIERSELRAHGFSDERIHDLAALTGQPADVLPTETEIRASISDEERRLEEYERLWNRVLLDVDGDHERFRPFWFWLRTPLFAGLTKTEQAELSKLFGEDEVRQEELWADVGRQRLRMIRDASDVLVCAEDLGAVPHCVPEVLEELDVLGLRVERWTRRWSEPGRPFLHPSSYPRATVCSPTVHDSSTLRGWWEEQDSDRVAYWQSLGREGEPPHELDTEVLGQVLDRNLEANSLLCVLALQDCLALFADLRIQSPAEERINVPGSRRSENWSYRMPLSLEALRAHESLRGRLRSMIDRRRGRPLR
jgi:4-alpha-glucanotransferase